MLFLLLRILTISISKDIVSYKDQRKDNKYKYKYSWTFFFYFLNECMENKTIASYA